MKKVILILLVLFCTNLTYGVSIPIFGKAGAVYENGGWKICPGFAFNKCASIEVSWSEIWDFLFKNDPTPLPVKVVVYQSDGVVSTLDLTLVGVSNSDIYREDREPKYLIGDDLIFK